MLDHEGFLSADIDLTPLTVPAADDSDDVAADGDAAFEEPAEAVDPETGRLRRVVRYRLRDKQSLNRYLEKDAARMRDEAVQRFGERFEASRRIWQARPQETAGELVVPETGYKRCMNCGSALIGLFCSNCGQRDRRRPPTLWELISPAFDDIFEHDSRFWRSLWPLMFRPGFLTREFGEGRRAAYLPPVRMYLVISIVFFLMASFDVSIQGDGFEVGMGLGEDAPITESAATSYSPPGLAGDDSPKAREPRFRIEDDDAEVAPDPATVDVNDGVWSGFDAELEAFRVELKQRTDRIKQNPTVFLTQLLDNIPTMMFVFLPLVAFVLMLLYPLSGKRYVEHVVFAVHYHSFFFLEVIILIALAPMTRYGITVLDVSWGLLTAVVVIWTPIYLFKAMRRVYGQGFFVTLLKYLMLGFAYLFSLLLTVLVGLLYTVWSY